MATQSRSASAGIRSSDHQRAQYVHDFLKALRDGEHSRSEGEKFRDFCEMMYCAWAKLGAESKPQADALEARYMQVVERYREKTFIRQTVPKLIEIACDGILKGRRDFLGETAAQLNVLNPGQGQFFTPYEVSYMMAQMMLTETDMRPIIAQQGFIRFAEPAVGSGGMVLAAVQVMEEAGFDPATDLLVEAWDVSQLAFQMCYIQLALRGIPAKVIRGNTLSMEVFETAWTSAALPFWEHHAWRYADPPASAEPSTAVEAPAAVSEPEPVDAPVVEGQPVQLSLF